MQSFRFLLSRRWILFALVVVLLAYAAWWLGEWQFRRLDERKSGNSVIRTNEALEPVAVEDVLAPGRPADPDDEWRLVTATGTYDETQTVVVRYRSRDGVRGVDAVVPLVTADGTALLVDRGWWETDPGGADRDEVPGPPEGEVDVTGWVRVDGQGDSTNVDDLSTRAISSEEIGAAIGMPVYGGFVDLRSEDPEPATKLSQVELPDLGNGPHFFYGLQWWFFGVLAVFGFFYLLWDEWRGGPRSSRSKKPPRPKSKSRLQAEAIRAKIEAQKAEQAARAQSERSAPPSTGSIDPDTYEDAGDSRKAAARPNSSGSP